MRSFVTATSFLLSCSCGLAAVVWTGGAAGGLQLQVHSDFSYGASLDGAPWLEGGAVGARCGGRYFSSAQGTLLPSSSAAPHPAF